MVNMVDEESAKRIILETYYNYDPNSFMIRHNLTKSPAVYTTKEYADPNKKLSYRNGVTIETAVTLYLTFFLFLAIPPAIYVSTLLKSYLFIISYPAFFALFYYIYYSLKFLHTYMIIDEEKISFRKQTFFWRDVYETYIIDEGNGERRPPNFYLVIGDTQGRITQLRITNMGASPRNIATVIEYFRHKNLAQTP